MADKYPGGLEDVNCRIGSLEKTPTDDTAILRVNCRIGSLEMQKRREAYTGFQLTAA